MASRKWSAPLPILDSNAAGQSSRRCIFYERNEKDEEKIIDEVIKDIYINKIDASVFINYGKKDGDIRMITKGEWSSGNEMPDGEKSKYLIENSMVVVVDDAQIQEKLQEIHKLTSKTEQQIYIYLDRETAKIKAVIGPEGIDGEATISSEQVGLGKDENGKIIYSKEIIRSGDIRGALLGQAHTHNLMYNKENNGNTGSSSTLGGEKTVNDFGTSEKDKATANSLNINFIFGAFLAGLLFSNIQNDKIISSKTQIKSFSSEINLSISSSVIVIESE